MSDASPEASPEASTNPGPDASIDGSSCTSGCQGTVLTTCDSQSNPVTKDCSTQKDSAGKAMTCDFLTDQGRYDCIGDYSSGCGTETLQGRCSGATFIHCLSSDTGNASDPGTTPVSIESIDCSQDPTGLTTCAVAPDGTAGCAAPNTTGCGGVPAEGTCNGTTLTKCVASSIQTTDCSTSAGQCGLMDDGKTNACISGSLFKGDAGSSTTAVTGTLVYEKLTVDTTSVDTAMNGFEANPVLTAVRRAEVQLFKADGTELQRGFTDETGAFSLNLPDTTTSAYVVVSTSADPTVQSTTVRDCPPSPAQPPAYPAGCTDQLGDVYQFKSAMFTGPTALGQLTATEASGLAGAFNIFNLMLKGQDFARVNLNGGAYPSTPPLLVEWKKGFETTTSYFATTDIVVQGSVADTDEFDDPVLMHEFGHFLQYSFSVSDSPGGSHDGTPTDPRLAFSEGYGTYVGCRIAGSSIYFDTTASGTSVTDINNTGSKANPNDPDGIKQLMSEYTDGEILWRLDLGTGGNQVGAGATNGQGSAPLFDVLGGYFKNNPNYNDTHGVSGRELVKFLDGWFCRDFQGLAAASTPVLQQVVTTDHGFPYDDFGHTIAPIGSCK